MKRRIIYAITLCLSSILLGGCSDDFLTRTPNDIVDPSNVDESTLNNMINGVYATIPGSSGDMYYDAYADNSFNPYPWESAGIDIQTGAINSGRDMGYSYTSIRVCNNFISLVSGLSIPDEKKKALLAEAKTMRAWQYMQQTLLFGDVPIILEVKDNIPNAKRTPLKEVRDFVVKELKDAINDLPEVSSKGRFNKYSAYAILARAAYYFGYYPEAEAAAKKVIDSGKFELFTINEPNDKMKEDAAFFEKLVDFNALGIDKTAFIKGIFSYEAFWRNEGNSEGIIYKEYYPTTAMGDWFQSTGLLPTQMPSIGDGWSSVVPMQDLVNAYWKVDGTEYTPISQAERQIRYAQILEAIKKLKGEKGSFQTAVASLKMDTVQYLNEFKNRDSRLYASIMFPLSSVCEFKDKYFYEFREGSKNESTTGYNYRKVTAIDLGNGDYFAYTGQDYALIRYAEILLIFAEARTQNSGYDGEVQAALNKIRTRCGMPNVKAGLSKADGIKLIRKERRIEMAGEGLRFFDIRLYEDPTRNGGINAEAASSVMKGQTLTPSGSSVVEKTWLPKMLLMPIPQTAIDKNKELTQNEGY